MPRRLLPTPRAETIPMIIRTTASRIISRSLNRFGNTMSIIPTTSRIAPFSRLSVKWLLMPSNRESTPPMAIRTPPMMRIHFSASS